MTDGGTDGRGAGFLEAWGPAGLWAAGILVLTTIPLPGGIRAGGLPLDKVLHAAMYSGLGWTVARALHLTGRSTAGAMSLAILAATGFAGLDEWHQSWVGRDAALGDWAADAVGLLLGLGLFLWRRRSAPSTEAGNDTEARTTSTGGRRT